SQSCLLEITFIPKTVGHISGYLTISTNDPEAKTINIPLLGEGLPTPKPVISLTVESLDFGSVIVGEKKSMSIEIKNTGNADLLIDSIKISDKENFYVEGNCGQITPGGSCGINVVFKPKVEGEIDSFLTIVSNDESKPTLRIPLHGKGRPKPKPIAKVDHQFLDFSDVILGKSKELTVKLTNEGNAPLKVENVYITGENKENFSVQRNCDNVEQGKNCDIKVIFHPEKAGTLTGFLIIETNDKDIQVSISGTGKEKPEPKAEIDKPFGLNFGSVFVGESKEKAVKVSNKGTADLEIKSIKIEGDKNVFSIGSIRKAQTQCSVLRPKEVCVITIVYKPDSFQQNTGKLIIETNDKNNPRFEVPLSGIGTEKPEPDIYVEKTLDFGNVEIGKSVEKTIEIQNNGTAELIVENLIISENGNFEIIGNCPVIKPKEKCQLEIIFHPTKEGKIKGSLKVVSNDPDEPQINVNLTGSGKKPALPEIFVSKKLINFGTLFLGETVTKEITVKNKGTGNLFIEKVYLNDSEGFNIESNCGTVEPEGKCTISIRFSPESEGRKTGTIFIKSNDPDNKNISVRAIGKAIKVQEKEIDLNKDGKADENDIQKLVEDVLEKKKETPLDLNDDNETDIIDIILFLKAIKLMEGR
ncbi:MAG: choice-of-anchor D domain-containing protein, partial [Aquificota bacterium]